MALVPDLSQSQNQELMMRVNGHVLRVKMPASLMTGDIIMAIVMLTRLFYPITEYKHRFEISSTNKESAEEIQIC
jgi:hypothetical protein